MPHRLLSSRRCRALGWVAALALWGLLPSLGAGGELAPNGLVATRLGNGVRLLYQYNPASPVVAVCAFVHASSAQETWNSAGTRELLQFMGERTRLRPGESPMLIPPPLELRTALSRDYVEMVALCLPEDLGFALGQLRAALFDPYFEEGVLQFAQQRLHQEVLARQSLALTAAQDVLVGRLYPQWPGSWPLVGTGAATWAKLDYVESFHAKHYLPNRTLLSIAGRISGEEVAQLAEQVFGTLVPGAPQRVLPPPVGAAPQPGTATVSLPESEISAVALGGRAPALVDEAYPATSVLMALLGTGRGSRLYRRLREDLKTSYVIQAGVTPSQVCPYAYLLAACNPEEIPSVTTAMETELRQVTEQPPTAAELDRARRILWGEYQVQQQDNQQLAHYLGLFGLLGDEQGLRLREGLAARLAAVRPEQVQEQCRRVFAQPVTVVIRGSTGSG